MHSYDVYSQLGTMACRRLFTEREQLEMGPSRKMRRSKLASWLPKRRWQSSLRPAMMQPRRNAWLRGSERLLHSVCLGWCSCGCCWLWQTCQLCARCDHCCMS